MSLFSLYLDYLFLQESIYGQFFRNDLFLVQQIWVHRAARYLKELAHEYVDEEKDRCPY